MTEPHPKTVGLPGRLLNLVETLGNKLPDPVTLFVIGALLVPVLSQLAYTLDWQVALVEARQVDGQTVLVESGEKATAKPMLSRDELYGMLTGLVKNFIEFKPLGIVLVGMLGIGVAERCGLVGASLKAFMLVTPERLLTPAMVFVGVMSSAGMDAGYVVLPPVAALLYISVGRSPLAGIAAVFAGVSAGFCANLAITGLDPLLSGLTQEGAENVDKAYAVAATSNWFFAAFSTVFLTFIGWAVTAWIVEPRLNARHADQGGPSEPDQSDLDAQRLTAQDKKGLACAGVSLLLLAIALGLLISIPGSPLHGKAPGGDPGKAMDRWVIAIVPLIFIAFLVPALAFGFGAGTIKSDKQIAKMMAESMAAMAPIIVLAFFAGQFIAWFEYCGLGTMLAITGGMAIADSGLPGWAILAGFILLVSFLNLFVGSMSAKYAVLAPIFVPMFMIGASFSPELTQAAYRVGDSCTNIITPLNAYLIIILVFVQKYDKKAGIGTMIALMLPYTIVFLITWTALLLGWVALDVPLGPGGTGPLEYVPTAQ